MHFTSFDTNSSIEDIYRFIVIIQTLLFTSYKKNWLYIDEIQWSMKLDDILYNYILTKDIIAFLRTN